MARLTTRRRSACVAGLALSVILPAAGCDAEPLSRAIEAAQTAAGVGEVREVLRVATCWPRAERERLEQDFLDWLARPSSETGRREGSTRLAWLALDPADLPERAAARLVPPDVLLGGPVSGYIRLADQGKLEPRGEGDVPAWLVASVSVVEFPEPASDGSLRPAFDDPRRSPETLAWAARQLHKGSWREGYARLVRLFGHSPHRPGWSSGSALAAVERREADITPRAGAVGPAKEGAAFPEGVAVWRGTRHAGLARAFLEFLVERRGARAGQAPDPAEAERDGLLVDLLGSTLVDAGEELRTAWHVLEGAESQAIASPILWMTEPPPWPPASVEKLRARGGERGEAMLSDLAGQIAEDPELRRSLLQSWLLPRRLIDDSTLGEIARLASGRLVREPRFRSWLRAEWTAWARQRYRRVARLGAAAVA